MGVYIGGYIGAYISGCVRSVNVWTLGGLPSMNDQQKPNTLNVTYYTSYAISIRIHCYALIRSTNVN